MHLQAREAWQASGHWTLYIGPVYFTCENDQKAFYKIIEDC